MPKYISATPISYPGGKTQHLPVLDQFFPDDFDVYCEPFVGGGSVFLHLLLKNKDKHFIINDANGDIMAFWNDALFDNHFLVREVQRICEEQPTMQELSKYCTDYLRSEKTLRRGACVFIQNRLNFGGMIYGTPTEANFKDFNLNAMLRLGALDMLPQPKGIQLYTQDYRVVLTTRGEYSNYFFFLDPPYASAEANGSLYGKWHLGFNHEVLFEELSIVRAKWLMTIDNTPEHIALVAKHKFYSTTYDIKYVFSNNNKERMKATELLVANYPLFWKEKENERQMEFSI